MQSNSDVLAVAMSCIACVRCESGQDHVARVSGRVCGVVMFRTCVVHLTMLFV